MPVEANVQVVVRCRPRNHREIQEHSHSVLYFEPLKPKELYIKPSLSDKGLFKAFNFDRVFAPEARQEVVYMDVVAPMLLEVMKGYNCTIFAYGQTGTGKTYTMEGSLKEVGDKFDDDAGIIPRAMYNLFQSLDASGGEYTVKLCCLELYNEELKDLLSMTDDAPKLRVYEDKKGLTVQGAEEATVQTAKEVLVLLQRANVKRRVAATNLNEHSSRSHVVYTITVFQREQTESGEELVKTGKLNLVDLAGSENIGRSGAEFKRAREAGMINQSLLTLGRVINSLVEKSPHVPYRESKLTRLLQDSLGGRTKTCIIATVSPARNCMEETQSTLDYAHRAKNIRNKPEINQKMTKRVLIAAYTTQIEKLKADLQASRDKNGVYLSQERLMDLNSTIESQAQDLEMVQRNLETKELQNIELKTTNENLNLELQKTTQHLKKTKTELESVVLELKNANRVIEAKQTAENTLHDLIQHSLEYISKAEVEFSTLDKFAINAKLINDENTKKTSDYCNLSKEKLLEIKEFCFKIHNVTQKNLNLLKNDISNCEEQTRNSREFCSNAMEMEFFDSSVFFKDFEKEFKFEYTPFLTQIETKTTNFLRKFREIQDQRNSNFTAVGLKMKELLDVQSVSIAAFIDSVAKYILYQTTETKKIMEYILQSTQQISIQNSNLIKELELKKQETQTLVKNEQIHILNEIQSLLDGYSTLLSSKINVVFDFASDSCKQNSNNVQNQSEYIQSQLEPLCTSSLNTKEAIQNTDDNFLLFKNSIALAEAEHQDSLIKLFNHSESVLDFNKYSLNFLEQVKKDSSFIQSKAKDLSVNVTTQNNADFEKVKLAHESIQSSLNNIPFVQQSLISNVTCSLDPLLQVKESLEDVENSSFNMLKTLESFQVPERVPLSPTDPSLVPEIQSPCDILRVDSVIQ